MEIFYFLQCHSQQQQQQQQHSAQSTECFKENEKIRKTLKTEMNKLLFMFNLTPFVLK